MLAFRCNNEIHGAINLLVKKVLVHRWLAPFLGHTYLDWVRHWQRETLLNKTLGMANIIWLTIFSDLEAESSFPPSKFKASWCGSQGGHIDKDRMTICSWNQCRGADGSKNFKSGSALREIILRRKGRPRSKPSTGLALSWNHRLCLPIGNSLSTCKVFGVITFWIGTTVNDPCRCLWGLLFFLSVPS